MSKKTTGEVPVIGDNVRIGNGAKILGGVEIGDNALIQANSVVLDNVHKNSIVAGIPAEIIKEEINIEGYKDW